MKTNNIYLFTFLIFFLFISNNLLSQPGTVAYHLKISALSGNFNGVLNPADRFSVVESIGDLNGDGVIDIAVGAYCDGDGGLNKGAVWILFLNSNGTVNSHQKISDTQGNFFGILDSWDEFGLGITSLGDVNGDGINDIAVGARYDDDGGTDCGAVWILFLNTNGTVLGHQKISNTYGNFSGVLDSDDLFGISLSIIGDLNNDGINELAVSSVNDDDGGTDCGAIWILFLNANGTVNNYQKISNSAGNMIGLLNAGDRFGRSIEFIGDFNNDGVYDIAVGSFFDDDGGYNRGAVWILFLNSNGTVNSYQKISDTQGNFTGILSNDNLFGISLTLLNDINGDGVNDIAVGARKDDDGGNDQGAVWILFLNSNGTVNSYQKISDTQGNFTGNLDPSDSFGTTVDFVGDMNGDGLVELFVGAVFDDDGGTNCGAVWLLSLNNSCQALSVNLGNDTLICETDTIILDAGNAGSNFLWSTGETTQTISVSPVISTEYTVIVEDSACYSYDTVFVEINNLPISSLMNDTTICDGDSLILIAGGGTSFVWSTDQYVDSILATNPGMYYVTISDGCGFIVDSVYVQVIPSPVVNFGNYINFCFGDSAILDAGNTGSTYLWSTGEINQSIIVSSSGLYYVFVDNICGFASGIVNVNEISQPIVNLGNDTTICLGDSVFLDAQNAGLSVLWSSGDTIQTMYASPSTPTIYSVFVDNFGCSGTDSIFITPLPNPDVYLGEDTTVCEKDSIFLDAENPGATYLWSDGSTNQTLIIMPDSAMTVFVDVSYSDCVDSDTFEINIFPLPQVNLGNDTVLCEGSTLELDAGNSGNSFFWSTSETSQQILISNSGTYYVAVTNQCEDTEGDSIIISLVQNPEINLGNDTTIGFSQIYTIDAGAGFISYLWSNGETNQTISLDSSIMNAGANYFSVIVTDSNYCNTTDSIIIYMIENQAINMQFGWNIISTYIDPFQANIDSVMNYLYPEIIIVKNTIGMTYWPFYNINYIGDMIIGEGYQVKMNSPQTLFVYGNAVTPELTPITIPQNWSFIGYLRQSSSSIETMLAPIVNEIVIVKNGDGLIFWPIYSINNIGDMIPGEGYQIKTVNSVILTYPTN